MSTFGLVDKADEARSREITQEYLNFLDDSADQNIYVQKVDDLIQGGDRRLIVNVGDIHKQLPERALGLKKSFVEEIVPLQQAAKEMISRVQPDYAKNRYTIYELCGVDRCIGEVYVGFEGAFGDRHVNPRTLKSSFLGSLVCCEGIVTKCSLVRPKVLRSVHYCPATKKTLERNYTDLTSYDAFPSSNVYPTEAPPSSLRQGGVEPASVGGRVYAVAFQDENKNPLETEFGLSTYMDHQTFSIQELPECAPAGQLPRSVDVIADDDLADRVKPGDRVRVIGLYRVLPNKQNGFSSGSFRSILISNNIQLLSKEADPDFDPEDVKNIRKLSKQKDIFELLGRSLAPSICGHEEVKKAILCLLLGGQEKILENGSRLRGDINVLLIGDPSVAKSQLLRYVLHTAPRAIATTGRGSSGVGLTAAVTTDSDTGERRLEAGAMVIADRGIVCIDEFDKMTDSDRTAIHEVMEQGRVTIAKAGIHARLNARCSVLAAANPVYGRYNPFKTPMENINMQDSLLSRFDLIFVLLDEHESERDAMVAKHVMRLHRWRAPGEADGAVLPMGAGVDTMSTLDLDGVQKSSDVWEKGNDWADDGKKILSMQFVKKYIHLARSVKPKLTENATTFISDVYAEIRSFDTGKSDRERTMPITARQLETLIRLSTAIARSRFSKTVERIDAEKAYNLLHYACFKEKPKIRMEWEMAKKRKAGEGEDEDMDMDDTESQENDETTAAVPPTPRGTRRRPGAGRADTEDAEHETTESETSLAPAAKRSRQEPASISVDRYKQFQRYVRKAFDDVGVTDDMVELGRITQGVQSQAGATQFSEGELKAAYEQMESDNAAMVADGKITLI